MSRNRLRGQRGQAMVLTVFFAAGLLGMATLVLDVGSWFRAQRDMQAVADSAALAGAQGLPDAGQANSLAREYVTKNKRSNPDVSFPDANQITVHVSRPTPGFFAKVFGIESVDVGGKATARSEGMKAARYAAPIAVDVKHPLLNCKPLPCFNKETELDLEKVGPGAFRLINLDQSKGGTGPEVLAQWMLKGYDGYMPLDWYFSDPGAKFNANDIQEALTQRIGTEMLFPIYDLTDKQGANFEYHVIGWVGFVTTSFEARGNGGKLHGYFVRVVWEGIQSETGEPDFGARAIELIE